MRTALLGICALFAALGCDTAPDVDGGDGTPDAGAAGDGGGPTDAGPMIDPLAASFVAAPTAGDGPWGTWGYMAVAVDDAHAIVLGGTDAGAGGSVFDTAWRVTVGPSGLSAERIDASGPRPRYCACAAYVPGRNTVVVYGGRDLDENVFAPETWELDLTSDTWTEMPTAGGPVETLGCAMSHAPGADRVYMFAGSGLSGPVAGTFRYDAGTWTRLAADGPSARYDAVLSPSRDGETLLLFGGSYGARGAAFFADLWRFDPGDESWSEIDMPDSPPGRRTAWVVVDPDREGLYVGFGYDGEMRPMGDLHYADLDARTWSAIEVPFEGPVARGFAPAIPGGDGALGALFGGFGATRPIVESWRFTR